MRSRERPLFERFLKRWELVVEFLAVQEECVDELQLLTGFGSDNNAVGQRAQSIIETRWCIKDRNVGIRFNSKLLNKRSLRIPRRHRRGSLHLRRDGAQFNI